MRGCIFQTAAFVATYLQESDVLSNFKSFSLATLERLERELSRINELLPFEVMADFANVPLQPLVFDLKFLISAPSISIQHPVLSSAKAALDAYNGVCPLGDVAASQLIDAMAQCGPAESTIDSVSAVAAPGKIFGSPDAFIVSGGLRIAAHAAVLASRSEVR